ncbi:MAG: hypothetical protein ABEI31_04095 [Halodesulfurarchaeum sp.]
MAGRRSLAVGITLLLVLAGCAGLPGGAPTGSNGATTPTPSENLDTDATPIYEPPLDTINVSVEHTLALRRAGSFTYNSTVTIVEANRSASFRLGRSARVDMQSGEMLIRKLTSGMGNQSVYVSPNGTTYVRQYSHPAGATYNTSNVTINTSRYAINGVPRFLDMFNLTYDGATTMDGVRVHRYSATKASQVTSLRGAAGTGQAGNLTSITARVYIAESGLIKRLGYTMAFQTGQGMHNVKAVTVYDRVGETTVQAPDWLDEAKQAAQGKLRVRRTVTNETAGASLTLTAKRSMFENIAVLGSPGPLYQGNHTYREAAASSAVTFLFPPSAENATVEINYDEAAIPAGNESELALYQYVATQNTWERVDATQNRSANTFSRNVSTSATLVVMHEATWRSLSEGEAA